MNKQRTLSVYLVDDDKVYLKGLEHSLNEKLADKIRIKTFQTGEDFLKSITEPPDIAILDYYLNSREKDAMNGISVLKKVKKAAPGIQVVMLSGQDNIDIAVDSMKNGAFDYIVKSEGAMVRAETVIRNIRASLRQVELLKIYKAGFTIVSIILAAILMTTFVLYIFFPELVRFNP